MSQSEGGPSRRRRQYVARACNSCRRRRCKCDGAQPVCGPCSTSGHECTWGTDGEDSGRPATKQFVESLRVKVQQLESEITHLKQESLQTQSPLDNPGHPSNSLSGLDPGSTELFWDVTDTPPIIESSQALPEVHPEPLLQPYSLPEHHQPIRSTEFSPVKVSVVNLPPFVPSIRYQYIFNIDTTLPLDEQFPLHRVSLTCQWNRYFPDLSPAQLTRFEHDIILFRCLTYGASCSFGLIPDLFLAELLECLAPETAHAYPPVDYRYYTPLLHCSLMAFGTVFSDSPEIRARETRAKFAAHAKQWLDQEFERPSPSLMVSLVMLSEYHSGVGERNLGHMYMGMAVRAARAPICPPNLFARDWHHWSAFVQECLMALEINRPSEMPVPQVPISCPIASESDNRPPLTDSPTELLNHVDYFKYSAQCFIQMCKLTVIAARMIDHPLNDAQEMLDIHLQLETWFNNLPEGVLIRQRATLTFPPVLALHITYWWFILYSHVSLTEQLSLSTPEPVRDLSIKMCARATEKLVQLFNTFDKQFGLINFPRNLIKSIFACGSALVTERDSASSASRKKRATATEGINACVHALKAVGDRWHVAMRMSQELETLAGVNSPN